MARHVLITGVSTGLGRAIALQILGAGHTVIGTVRNPDQVADFEALAPSRAHARVLDVTDTAAIGPVIEDITATIGAVDVLINNAGYGVEGIFEELTLADFRNQFEVNVFGTVAITRAVLPGMRVRRSGHIFFITSIGGLRAFPGLSAYHGSKYAVEGIADSLRQEVAPLGVQVTSIEPGAFRTDWAGRSMYRAARNIADYGQIFDDQREARQRTSGAQPGDPVRAGDAILEVLESNNPPGHLLLGTDALESLAQARNTFDVELSHWRRLSASTDFAETELSG
jgi:NAD(P)-dependent dehydrogenase (short-subunit alcohol dehydrogenase family)